MVPKKIILIASVFLIAGLLVTGFFIFRAKDSENAFVPDRGTSMAPQSQPGGEDRGVSSSPQAMNFTWTKESGQRIAGGIPFAHKLMDGRIRLYYCGQGGVLSAISSDGLNFTKESGTRIGPGSGNEAVVCDPTLVTLSDGRVRLYYKGADGMGGPGKAIHKIYSAISLDGLLFTKEGTRIDSEQTDDRGWASVPEALRLLDGRVRLYYVSDSVVSGHGTVSAISSDGLIFTKEDTKLTGYVDPSVTTLPDGRYLLLASPPMEGGGIYSFVSNDGIHFEKPQIVLAESEAIDPAIIMLGDQNYRVYYWLFSDQPSIIYSLMGLLH